MKRCASPRPSTAVSCTARVRTTVGPIAPQLSAPAGRHERVQRGLGRLAGGLPYDRLRQRDAKRKGKEASGHAEHAGSGSGVAAAHPVDGSPEEEVELVRHGSHLHVAQSPAFERWRRAASRRPPIISMHSIIGRGSEAPRLLRPGRCQNGSGESSMRRGYHGTLSSEQIQCGLTAPVRCEGGGFTRPCHAQLPHRQRGPLEAPVR